MRPIALCLVGLVVAGGCAASMTIDDYADALGDEADAYVVESQDLSYDYQRSVEDGVAALSGQGEGDPIEEAITAP